jgi:putative tryptophan/tyrosine transport system substrate-binding protein
MSNYPFSSPGQPPPKAPPLQRRETLALMAGVLACWPLAATLRATEPVRRVGVLHALPEHDPAIPPRILALEAGLRHLGWTVGRNLQIHHRFASEMSQIQTLAKELNALAPDVLVASAGMVVPALLRENRTIPIVFVTASDPIGDGFVTSLARPENNATGFTNSFASMSGKWLELLKLTAPQLMRVGMMFNPDTAPNGGTYFLPPFEAAARSNGLLSIPIPVRSREDIGHALAALGQAPDSGLIVMPDNFTSLHRRIIIKQTEQQRLPAVYPFRYFAMEGGLISYGPDLLDLYRRTPSYVDRILKGVKVSDLPVQAPVRFDLVINLKAARAQGMTVPRVILARADEIIE